MSHPPQVIGLGQCCLDTLGQGDRYPDSNAKCELSRMAIQGGGPVATALVALSRWGASCSFIGVVGDDDFGGQIRESLDSEGINIDGLLIRANSASQFAFIFAEKPTGSRTVFWRRPTGSPPGADELDYEVIRSARVLHTDGLFSEASIAAAKAARAAGMQVVVDAGSLREGMLELARHSDHFLASETFARALIGGDDPHEACERLAELGPEVVGVTLGERGYVALRGGQFVHGAAYAVEAVDTTGCGDVFHAGYIHGLLQGWPLEDRLDFAAWAAAEVSTRLGGREGIPRERDWPRRHQAGAGRKQGTGLPSNTYYNS